MDKEMLKVQGENLIKDQQGLAVKMVTFITNAMKEVKDIHTFDNFNKKDGEFIIDDDYNCVGDDTIPENPIITAYGFDTATDYYLVGIRYEERKNDVRKPYIIWFDCVPYDDMSYVKYLSFEEIASEDYPTIVEYITNNL